MGVFERSLWASSISRSSIFATRPSASRSATTALPGLVHRQPLVRPGVLVERAVGVEDVDHRQLLPQADFVVVRIVGRRDLHAAGAQLRLGPDVGDQRNLAVQQRQLHLAAVAGHVAQACPTAASIVRRRSARSSICFCNVRLVLRRRGGQPLRASSASALIKRRGRIGMHGHGRVAEHRFGPRGGDRHVRRLARLGIDHRIAEVPEVALRRSRERLRRR